MNDIRVIIALVLGMLFIERLLVLGLTKREGGKKFFRKVVILHPNAISIMRLPMGVLSAWFASMGHWTLATLWFAFWMITDLSDGTIARNCDLGSESGKWLDPLSDKFMYFPVLLFFVYSESVNPSLHPVPVICFIVIDIIGQASRLFVKKKAANQFGKAKTALVTILLSLLALNQIDELTILTKPIADGIMFAALLLAFFSCYCKVIPDNWYANTLTLANFVCGVAAIYHASQGHFVYCIVLVFIGQFFDLFDGRLARKFGSTKRGPLFDDIADATSFGLAIGTMIFFCMRERFNYPIVVALICSVYYVFCLIYRLYRFLKPTKEMPKGIFQGLPSPAGAMFAGSSVLVALDFSNPTIASCFAAICVLASGTLMVSNIPYCHFGQTMWPSMHKPMKLLFLLLLLMLTVFAVVQKSYRPSFVWCCFLFTLVYLIYGIHWVNRMAPAQFPKQEE